LAERPIFGRAAKLTYDLEGLGAEAGCTYRLMERSLKPPRPAATTSHQPPVGARNAKRTDVDLSKSEQSKSARRLALELDTNCFSISDNWCSEKQLELHSELLVLTLFYWRSNRVIGVQTAILAFITIYWRSDHFSGVCQLVGKDKCRTFLRHIDLLYKKKCKVLLLERVSKKGCKPIGPMIKYYGMRMIK